MFIYAQLNENKVCIGISQLSGPVDNENMIPIESFDLDKLWRKYENGQWSAEKYEPQTTSPLTDYELTKKRIDDIEQAIVAILGGVV